MAPSAQMAKLKAGVLTFHRCINYGSYWQAKCLVEGLRARGLDAVLLDHDSRRISLAEWKCGFRPTLPTPVPRSDRSVYRDKMLRFFRCFERLPLSPRFEIDDPDKSQRYDVVVVGSDEVWNLSHPWYGRYPIFYGEGINAGRIVSYAASFGNYPASWGLERSWTERLGRFAAISVRDENSRTIVSNSLGFQPDLVLDPCLQFDLTPESRDPKYAGTAYAAVYGHNFSARFVENIRQWAKRRDLPLVSIGYRNEWADEQWINADPHDFAHFIAGAEAVATNFFHGCVFALRNQKPFVCESSGYRSNKLDGLMNKIGGQRHLVREDTTQDAFAEVLDQPLEGSISVEVATFRGHSDRYLTSALSA